MKKKRIKEALEIIEALDLPKAQRNERSALCLLALLNMTPQKNWSDAENPLIGITPVMNWVLKHYKKLYAPNTRETFRRQTMHQFVDAGLVLYNPDDTERPVNSPKAVYQVEPETFALLRSFGTNEWKTRLQNFQAKRETLIAKYANERKQNLIPVKMNSEKTISLSPGDHSQLIRSIVEEFAPRFAPGSSLIYVGDTGNKYGFLDQKLLEKFNVQIDLHGKMPDVVLYLPAKNWILLVEAVTSHGPVDGKRHGELAKLFETANAGLVYVTAFPNRQLMSRYVVEIAWETEVWVSDAPSHLIHFNGERFLGPYSSVNSPKN